METPFHIGLILHFSLAYPRGVLRGIRKFAQSQPHWTLVPHEAERFTAHTLSKMRPDGLIAHVATRELAELLQRQPRPIVNVSFALPDAPFPRIGVDQREAGRMAFRHLHERGFRHFGLVGHPRHLYSTEREAGFRDALIRARRALGTFPLSATGRPGTGRSDSQSRRTGRAAASQATSPHTVCPEPNLYSLECYYEHPARSFRDRARLLALSAGLQDWLRALPKPVGVFACHDVWGVQVVEACRLTGIRVPDEVAVVSVDNDEMLCELARPSLSSIILPAEHVGFAAAALLERLLQRAKPPRRPRLIPPLGVATRQSSDVLACDDPDVTSAVRFMRESAHRPLKVNDVLRAVPVTRRSLERKFRTVLQCGIGEEIRRIHLERAKELLASTELSVTEVAAQAGFSSVHHLSRVFRRDTGQTPTQFRTLFPMRPVR